MTLDSKIAQHIGAENILFQATSKRGLPLLDTILSLVVGIYLTGGMSVLLAYNHQTLPWWSFLLVVAFLLFGFLLLYEGFRSVFVKPTYVGTEKYLAIFRGNTVTRIPWGKFLSDISALGSTIRLKKLRKESDIDNIFLIGQKNYMDSVSQLKEKICAQHTLSTNQVPQEKRLNLPPQLQDLLKTESIDFIVQAKRLWPFWPQLFFVVVPFLMSSFAVFLIGGYLVSDKSNLTLLFMIIVFIVPYLLASLSMLIFVIKEIIFRKVLVIGTSTNMYVYKPGYLRILNWKELISISMKKQLFGTVCITLRGSYEYRGGRGGGLYRDTIFLYLNQSDEGIFERIRSAIL